MIFIIAIPMISVSAKDFYRVKKGDTLWSISIKNKISVSEIKKLNNLKSDTIFINQKLTLKKNEEEKKGGSNNVHTVSRGDTLWSISIKYGMTVQEIKTYNNLNSDIIRVGQKLKLKSGLTNEDKKDDKSDNENVSDGNKNSKDKEKDKEKASVYTVKRGDTLWSISRVYGMSVDELMKINKLNSTTLLIGQKLKVDEQNASPKERIFARTTSNLNLRKSSNEKSGIILTIPKGSRVEVIENSGVWWKVKYNNKTGFSHSDYMKIDNANIVAKVNASALHIREKKSSNSKSLLLIPNGTIVNVLNKEGTWWEVSYNGVKGYSHSDYLVITDAKDVNKPTRNKVIILDPGHGGPDPGAVNGNLKEADLTTAIASKTKSELEKLGYKVYLTRKSVGETCTKKGTGTEELKCRVEFAKDKKGDIYVSIHVNSGAPGVRGSETFFNETDNYDGNTNPFPKESKRLANAVHKSYQPVFGSLDRGVKNSNFYVNRMASMPSILLEVGFLTSVGEKGDREKLINSNMQDKVALAIAQGINEYFEQ